nr:hypothetical protein [Candidatus Sigynarchaeota archaeon]
MVRARTARIASIALMLAIVVMVGTRSLVASGSATALVWERTWGGTEMEAGRGVATATDGMVYMAGYTDSFGMGFSDAFLAKYDASGTLLWNRTCGGTSTEFGCNVAIAADETIYLAGSTSSAGAGGLDAFLAKYNATGSQLWNRTWGGTSSDLGWGVAAADDG